MVFDIVSCEGMEEGREEMQGFVDNIYFLHHTLVV